MPLVTGFLEINNRTRGSLKLPSSPSPPFKPKATILVAIHDSSNRACIFAALFTKFSPLSLCLSLSVDRFSTMEISLKNFERRCLVYSSFLTSPSYRIIARFSKLKILRRRSLITYERITFRDWTIDAPFRVRRKESRIVNQRDFFRTFLVESKKTSDG